MKKEDIYKCFNRAEPTDEQKSRMLNNILNEDLNSSTTKQRRPMKTKLILATSLIVLITTTAIGTNISTFLQMKDKMNPDIVDHIEPIEKTSVDKGIKVEVVAVGRFDNMIKAYVTVEDLVSDRIGEDLSFFDYFSLSGKTTGSSFGNSWSMVDYDQTNKKATLFVESDSDEKFKGENLTLKFDKIFYNHKEYEDYQIGIDLTKLGRDEPHLNARLNQFMSWSGGTGSEPTAKKIPILTPHIRDFTFAEIKSTMISNIGLIDDKLHIQLWKDKEVECNSVNPYLSNLDGERLDYASSFYFGINKSGKIIGKPSKDGSHQMYKEYIFDVDVDKLDQYKLLGDISTSSEITGDWKVTFKAEDSGKLLEVPCQINIEEIKINKLKINPFGINIIGTGENGLNTSEFDVKINTKDGVIEAGFSSGSWDNDKVHSLYEMKKPIDLDSVESVTINGQTVLIK